MQFEFLPNTGLVAAIIALILGIIMIVKPRIVAYLIGAYLVIIAVIFFVQHYVL